MKFNIIKFIKKPHFPIVIFAIAIFFILLQMNFQLGADDGVWIKEIEEKGIFKYLYDRNVNWQPGFGYVWFALIYNNIMLWRLISSILAAIGMFCISKYMIEDDNNKIFNICVFISCVFFFLSPYVITSGVMWVVGGIAYLWPTVLMLIALMPFVYALYNKKIKKKGYNVIIFLSTIQVCFGPQILAILICFGGLVILYLLINKKHIPGVIISQYIMILLLAIIVVDLTISAGRYNAEKYWYVNFDMLNTYDKLFQGINWTNFHFINSSNLIFLIITILIYINIYKKNKDNVLLCILAIIPMIYFIINIIPFEIIIQNININNSNAEYWTNERNSYKIENVLFNYVYNTNHANPQNILLKKIDLLPSFIGLVIMLYTSILLFITFDKKEDKFITVVLYFAALCSGYMLSFSPTIFASGSRIFFISNILMIFIAAKLFTYSLNNGFTYSRIASYSFIIFTIILWSQFVLFFPKSILWL